MLMNPITFRALRCARAWVACLILAPGFVLAAPYPPSTVINDIQFDFSTLKQAAPGSDLWPTTWADDDNLYTCWGDGGGFGGSNTLGRVTIGLGKVTGTVDNLLASNIWGGVNPATPATFDGKCNGLLSVNGVLYLAATEQDSFRKGYILVSADHGLTWTNSASNAYLFAEADAAFSDMTFLQFGRDYQGARDNFVYVYSQDKRANPAPRVSIALFRVPLLQISSKTQFEYFAGLDANLRPLWTSDITQRQPVFVDPAGIGFGVRVSYNPGLKRYLLSKWRDVMDGAWGVYDAPEPWGPWSTVKEYATGEWIDASFKFGFTFPNKWLSTDGRSFVMIFSGLNALDSWNTLSGKFISSVPANLEIPAIPSVVELTIQGR